jgi:hypothetical protein
LVDAGDFTHCQERRLPCIASTGTSVPLATIVELYRERV